MPVSGRAARVHETDDVPLRAHRVLRVTAAIIRRGRRILIARRAGDDPLAGLWEFPGGKIHPGELPEACLVREIWEELGLRVGVVRALGSNEHRYPERTVRLLFFEVESLSGRVKLNAHDRVAWVYPVAMKAYVFAPADRPMVDHIVMNGGVAPLLGVAVRSARRKRRRPGSGFPRLEA